MAVLQLNIGLETNDGTPRITASRAHGAIRALLFQSGHPGAQLTYIETLPAGNADINADGEPVKVEEDTALFILRTSATLGECATVLSRAAAKLHQSAIAALNPRTNIGYLFGTEAGKWGGFDWVEGCTPEDCRKGFDPKRFIII